MSINMARARVVRSLTPANLLLPYSKFQVFVSEIMPNLNDHEKRWLAEWELWDLANSPMPDEERSSTRYGHFLGWFAGTWAARRVEVIA